MENKLYHEGLKVRKEVLSEEYVDKAISGADSFNKEFQELISQQFECLNTIPCYKTLKLPTSCIHIIRCMG